MDNNLKDLLKNFSNEDAEKVVEVAMSAKDAKDLFEKSKKFGINLDESTANEIFETIRKPLELSSEDLAKVAGGSGGGGGGK